MPLTVLSVAYPFAPTGPRAVGGAEQVLTAIDRALTQRGHRSVVVACEGSESTGELVSVPLPSSESLTDSDRLWVRKRVQAAIDRTIGAYPIDVVHMHGLDFADYVLPRGVPVVATLHLPISWYGDALYTPNARRASLCCVSESQLRTCPPELGLMVVIENGVEIPRTPVNSTRDDFALVLGRICPEKNAHEALQAGTLAGIPVRLAGQVFPYAEHKRYFQQQLQPLLRPGNTGVQHRFLGAVDSSERSRLLSRAKCLLHPTLAPETSSLVAMEALAAGTPVIAYGSGALPEIISDGITGFLVDSPETMAEAMHHLDRISPERCRREARERFSHERMVSNYLNLYDQLIADFAQSRRYA